MVLTGQAGVFSAGLDFNESFSVFGSQDTKRISQWFDRYRATNFRVFTYPRPTVAAINGHAYAGGLITALNCDFRIASAGHSKFCLNEVPIGIPMPAAYLEIIRYATGINVPSRASLFGEGFTVEMAKTLGFVHEISPESDLVAAAVRKVATIPPPSFAAYAFSKKALQTSTLESSEKLRELDSSIATIISSKNSLSSLASRYEQIKGSRPSWDPR